LPAYQAELLRRGLIFECIDVYQTIGNAQASAGTHSKGGCVDIAQRNREQLRVARNMGGAALERDHDPNDGQPDFQDEHAHISLKGCPHAVRYARDQVDDLEDGYSALGQLGDHRGAVDDGPRDAVKWPLRTWEEGIAWAKAQAQEATVAERLYPAEVLDMTNTKVTLPTGVEVKQPLLAKFRDKRFFNSTKSGKGVVFRATVGGGGTTPKSKFQRCEEREMVNKGRELANWDSRDGTNSLSVTLAVTELPPVHPEIVVGQIHDDVDDVVMVRVVGIKNPNRTITHANVFAEFSKGPGKGSWKQGLGRIKLGDEWSYRVEATKAGMSVTLNGTARASDPRVRDDCYFKDGCYLQSNTSKGDKPDAAGVVVIYKRKVSHR
jgi:hypothetical protein